MITSRRNPVVQRARAVAAGAKAAPEGLCFVEGVRLVEEWLRSGLRPDAILLSDAFGSTSSEAELGARLEATGCEISVVAADVLESVSAVRQNQGVAVVCERPNCTLADVLRAPDPMIVVAAGVQDPGNLGTIVRTAHAAGACGVVTTPGTVSPFNAKCIRSSAGSVLHLPVAADVAFDVVVREATKLGVKFFACSPLGETSYLAADLAGGVAFVLGREGSGLPAELEGACDHVVHIPMAAGVESLNVAASAAVLLFEAARQRGARKG